jgi:hypothetical protein
MVYGFHSSHFPSTTLMVASEASVEIWNGKFPIKPSQDRGFEIGHVFSDM